MKSIIHWITNKLGIKFLRLKNYEALAEEFSSLKLALEKSRQDHDTLLKVWSQFSQLDRMLYSVPGHGPALQIQRGANPNKVLVCSLPKCGTYFLGTLLQQLGYCETGVHLWQNCLHDYRGLPVEERRQDISPRQVPIHLQESLPLIQTGQFCVGHFPYKKENVALFRDFKVLFIHRNLRDACVSQMRFASELKPLSHRIQDCNWQGIQCPRERFVQFLEANGEWFQRWIADVAGWICEKEILSLSYDSLTGRQGQDELENQVHALANFLSIDCNNVQLNAEIQKARQQKTMTSTGNPSRWQDYWSEEAEIKFRDLGFEQINQQLGYDEECSINNSKVPLHELVS